MNKVWVFNTKEEIDALDCVRDVIKHLQKETGQKLNSYEQEIVFLEVMKEKGIKPAGHNELTKAEFIKELVSKGKKILSVDQNGFTFIKKKEK